MIPMPSRGQLAHDPEQLLRLMFGQRGGRLVQDQDAAVQRQGLGDLDQLLLGDRQPPGGQPRVDVGQRRQAPRRRARSGLRRPSAAAGTGRFRDMKMFSATEMSAQSAIS